MYGEQDVPVISDMLRPVATIGEAKDGGCFRGEGGGGEF
ncbi:hypothetical protein METP1_01107 [Methanosarcinales archaeon]|nr:hypothetical protein METP1_01107 [Methanosarcinales archaeon]